MKDIKKDFHKDFYIPLPERDALAGLLKVKPTEMPRRGSQATGKKKRSR